MIAVFWMLCSPIATSADWGRPSGLYCVSSSCSKGECQKCEGVPKSSDVCKMVNGFDFGTGITSSETDDSYLESACTGVADGGSSWCDNIPDQSQKTVCTTIAGQGNAVAIWKKPSCHIDHGHDGDYNYCRVYNCVRNPQIPDLDGHCDESEGCQGTFYMLTRTEMSSNNATVANVLV